MTVSIMFDPNDQADLLGARSILDKLALDAGRNSTDDTDVAQDAADDLLRRLGSGGQELLNLTATFDRPFSLPDLAGQTGDTISKMKSRWANLARSIAQTSSRFGNVKIFQEQVPAPNGAGYFTFVMDAGIRDAVRNLRQR